MEYFIWPFTIRSLKDLTFILLELIPATRIGLDVSALI
ncbi:hypothetical protein EV06_0185 [Prochlorococcus sp. MIT 0602]|nr:hypothetical protein EV07_1375 [Prochlorococcus sp. MIT 0603]KGG18057.1 hypothetical protein EV06_0185 [Prochlorococcus sp. MIT 0602]